MRVNVSNFSEMAEDLDVEEMLEAPFKKDVSSYFHFDTDKYFVERNFLAKLYGC